MKKQFKQKNKTHQKGFTLLFAVLVSTLILAVGASIISIALKQIILSGSARDSHFAFYASNSGIECALYWDFVGIEGEDGPVFATSSLSQIPIGSTISCADSNPEINGTVEIDYSSDNWSVESELDQATTTFRVELGGEDIPYCVDVSVSKWEDADGDINTAVNSRGYNTCDTENRRRIERGLRILY